MLGIFLYISVAWRAVHLYGAQRDLSVPCLSSVSPLLGLRMIALSVATLMSVPQLHIESLPYNTLKIEFLDVSWAESNV